MFTISMDPIILSIGHFHLRWYSLIVATAMYIGIWFGAREAERKGFKKEDIYNAALWIILFGVAGARLFHVIDHWSDEFSSNPMRIFYLWDGGLAIWGGLLGGILTIAVLARLNHWKTSRLLDALAPGAALGMAIGRVACIITGDSVGKATSGPFGFAYTSPNVMVPQLGVYYTPMPVYEILMNLGIFAILWKLRRKNLPDGLLSLVYLVLYSTFRFFITFWSSYLTVAFGLNQAQLVSIAVVLVSIPWIMILLRKRSNRGAQADRFTPVNS